MLAIVNSCALNGLAGYRVMVEVDVGVGLSAFEIVGLPDASVRESRERVRAALKNSGFDFPLHRIIVNLAPAEIKKEGPALDLPIAIGILLATGQLPDGEYLQRSAFVGALSLEGSIQASSGALAIADFLSNEEQISRLFVAADNAAEAAIMRGIDVFGVSSLKELVQILRGEQQVEPAVTDIAALFAQSCTDAESEPDMSEVRGQRAVKRALEVAAAGGITCCSSVLRAAAKPCWRVGCRLLCQI